MKELNLVRTIVRDSNINRCIQNHSNDSRVSKTDVKSFSSQYVLDGSIQNTRISCIII